MARKNAKVQTIGDLRRALNGLANDMPFKLCDEIMAIDAQETVDLHIEVVAREGVYLTCHPEACEDTVDVLSFKRCRERFDNHGKQRN